MTTAKQTRLLLALAFSLALASGCDIGDEGDLNDHLWACSSDADCLNSTVCLPRDTSTPDDLICRPACPQNTVPRYSKDAYTNHDEYYCTTPEGRVDGPWVEFWVNTMDDSIERRTCQYSQCDLVDASSDVYCASMLEQCMGLGL